MPCSQELLKNATIQNASAKIWPNFAQTAHNRSAKAAKGASNEAGLKNENKAGCTNMRNY